MQIGLVCITITNDKNNLTMTRIILDKMLVPNQQALSYYKHFWSMWKSTRWYIYTYNVRFILSHMYVHSTIHFMWYSFLQKSFSIFIRHNMLTISPAEIMLIVKVFFPKVGSYSATSVLLLKYFMKAPDLKGHHKCVYMSTFHHFSFLLKYLFHQLHTVLM